jgi:hypothetical protein
VLFFTHAFETRKTLDVLSSSTALSTASAGNLWITPGRSRLRGSGCAGSVAQRSMSKVNSGTWIDPSAGKMTLRRYVEQTYLPAQTSEATSIKATENRFRVRILPALGDRTLGQPAAEPSVIKAWAAGLRAELADSYVRTLMATLSAALNSAVTDGLISRNPCPLVKPPKAPAARVQPWTSEQVSTVRKALPARYRALADAGVRARAAPGRGVRAGRG